MEGERKEIFPEQLAILPPLVLRKAKENLRQAAKTPFVICSSGWRERRRQFLRARFYHGAKIRLSLLLPRWESCWGVPSPNPAMAACAAKKFRTTSLFALSNLRYMRGNENRQLHNRILKKISVPRHFLPPLISDK